MCKRVAFFMFLIPFAMACTSSSSIVADNFSKMGDIAIANASHCDQLALKLNEYLDINGTSFRKAVLGADEINASETRQIQNATTRFNLALAHCPDDVLLGFRARLADIVFPENNVSQ